MTYRYLLCAITLAAALFGATSAGADERSTIAVQVIVDNGGTVMEEDAPELIKNLIGGLANLRGRAFSEATVDLILTSHPTTVWSGTPRDLMTQAHAVLDLVALNDKCSDVGRALRQANQNLRVAAADESYLIIYAPLISAPFPCDEGPGITLPQPVPQGLNIGRMIAERGIRALKIFGVHPSQEPVWTDYLDNEGVLALSRSGHLDFQFLGFQQSKTFLSRQRLLTREGR